MHFVQAKTLLNRENGMNVYRGCMHGCVYCDSRSRCYQFTHPFEDIEVKENAPELLETILRTKRKKIMIGTGSMCDPYQPCEMDLRIVRRCSSPHEIRPGPQRPGSFYEYQQKSKSPCPDDADDCR